jgi:hypothetical protein
VIWLFEQGFLGDLTFSVAGFQRDHAVAQVLGAGMGAGLRVRQIRV